MKIAYTFTRQTEKNEAQAEFDTPETIAMLEGGLTDLGHEVVAVDTSVGVGRLVSELERQRPDLVFNTAEDGPGRAREAFYPALFDALRLPYTGSDAYTCTVTLDKQLTKMMLVRHAIPMARSRFATSVDDLADLDLRFPVIVKPNFEGSSMGITDRSVVESAAGLAEVVAETTARFPLGVVIEEFIVGRDVVVPFLAAAAPGRHGVLEPAEYVYRDPGRFGIFDLNKKMRGFDDVDVRAPARLEEAQRVKIHQLSCRVIAALGIRDLGRLDFRLGDDGQPYFLEMNAIPSLEPGASIYLSGALAGLSTTAAVLGAVVASAVARTPHLADAR
jgi:D-alanine-D-alanine ligase